MGLAETNIIDFVVENKKTGGYDLIVIDAGDIADEVQRYTLLTEKLACYASYVFDGRLKEEYPKTIGKELAIIVVCWRKPNEAMNQLEAIKSPDDAGKRLDVTFIMKKEYYAKIKSSSNNPSKAWWKFWK